MPERLGAGVDMALIDAHIGRRLRAQRRLLCQSLDQLAGRLGLTARQLAQYEDGALPIGAARLYEISQVLDVPVACFFAGLSGADGRAGDVRDD